MLLGYNVSCIAATTPLSSIYFDLENVLSTGLTGLMTYTNYTCSIQARTSVGSSSASNERTARTDEDGELGAESPAVLT